MRAASGAGDGFRRIRRDPELSGQNVKNIRYIRWIGEKSAGAIRLFQLRRKNIIVRPQHSTRSDAYRRGNTQMAEYKIGTMDITEQKKTYKGFIDWTVRAIIVCILIVVFLAVYVA
jgi:hypothetical protein